MQSHVMLFLVIIIKFWPLPHPLSPPRGSDPGLRSKITFDMFHIYCTSVCMRNFSKILTID